MAEELALYVACISCPIGVYHTTLHFLVEKFNKENKMDKQANNERASEAENDISEIIDNLEVSQDEDDIESDDNSEVEDEFESTDLKVKTFYHATAIWEHYKPWLSTNCARVAYLCSPHPPIIAHYVAHKDPSNIIAVDEFIRMVILPRRQTICGNPNVVLA